MLIKKNSYFHVKSHSNIKILNNYYTAFNLRKWGRNYIYIHIVPYQTGSSTRKYIYYTELICIYTQKYSRVSNYFPF